MSSNDANVTGLSAMNTPQSIRWVSRRLFLQYQLHVKSKSSSKLNPSSKINTSTKDETPWPRNVVYGTYVVMSICIPYSIAWFLSSNEPIRNMIFSSFTKEYYESSFIIEWMRHHFGIPDDGCISEPEMVQLFLSHQSIPYRFVDEPTKRIRHEQLYINQQQERNMKFRIISGTATPNESIHIVDLPAKTVARYDDLVKVVVPTIQPPIALDFDDCDDDDHEQEIIPKSSSTLDDNTLLNDTTITIPSMSIYSLWHYHQSPKELLEQQHSSNTTGRQKQLSPIQMELSHIQYELDKLHQELKQSSSSIQQRPIDDIQEEIVQLKTLKRQLQWRNWLSW